MKHRGYIVKRFTFAFAVLLLIAALAAPMAFAANPHFINASASLNNDGSLKASFKEAGLGDSATVNIVLSADASATYACLNGGGKHPQATNKATINGPVSASGDFTSGKNGSVQASLTVFPPGPGGFSCPNGQRLVLASVSYTNVMLTDTTNNVYADVPGTFTKVFFDV